MIRQRYIKRNTREWVLIKTTSPDALCRTDKHLLEIGFADVGIVQFLKHRLFRWRKPPNEEA